MARGYRGRGGVFFLVGFLLVGCGSSSHTFDQGPLRLSTGDGGGQVVTSPDDPNPGGRSWSVGVTWPVGRLLTIGPVHLIDTGPKSLVLMSFRPLAPAPGLQFGSASFSDSVGSDAEDVGVGGPAAVISSGFGQRLPLHDFSPLPGAKLDPTGQDQNEGTAFIAVTATRPGRFHIGDWVVSYRVGSTKYRRVFSDNAFLCAGIRGCRAPLHVQG